MAKKKKEVIVGGDPRDVLMAEFTDNLVNSKMSVLPTTNLPKIRSGIIGVDYVTGGFPRGRMVEIAGQEASGKTSIGSKTFFNMQGGLTPMYQEHPLKIAYIDGENKLDYNFVLSQGIKINLEHEVAEKIGIKMRLYKELLCPEGIDIFIPSYGENALDFMRRAVELNAYDMIWLDSKDSLTPSAEREKIEEDGGYGGSMQMGRQAQMYSFFCRDFPTMLGRSKTCVVMISQLREKIGVMFGNPETTSGGRALKFNFSWRLYLSEGSAIKKKLAGDDTIIGRESKIRTVKNQIYTPFLQDTMFVMRNEGCDVWRDAIVKGTKYGVITKSGSYYSWKEHKLGQGLDNAVDGFKHHEHVTYQEVYLEVLKAMMDEQKEIDERTDAAFW